MAGRRRCAPGMIPREFAHGPARRALISLPPSQSGNEAEASESRPEPSSASTKSRPLQPAQKFSTWPLCDWRPIFSATAFVAKPIPKSLWMRETEMAQRLLDTIAQTSASPFARLLAESLATEVRKAVESFPEYLRTAFISEYQDVAHAEDCFVLKCSFSRGDPPLSGWAHLRSRCWENSFDFLRYALPLFPCEGFSSARVITFPPASMSPAQSARAGPFPIRPGFPRKHFIFCVRPVFDVPQVSVPDRTIVRVCGIPTSARPTAKRIGENCRHS